MATISAASVRLGSYLKPGSWSNQCTGSILIVKSISFSWSKSSFSSSRSSRLQVCCAAKPETVAKVSEIVKKQLALSDETPLTPESTFSALGADSLDTVEIVMGLEEEFGITVEEDSSPNITTVQEAADLIEKLIEQKDETA